MADATANAPCDCRPARTAARAPAPPAAVRWLDGTEYAARVGVRLNDAEKAELLVRGGVESIDDLRALTPADLRDLGTLRLAKRNRLAAFVASGE